MTKLSGNQPLKWFLAVLPVFLAEGQNYDQRMSKFQQQLFKEQAARAQSASAAASSDLLNLLGNPRLLQHLQSLGGVAADLARQGPEALLSRLRADMEVTELLTSFPADATEEPVMCGMNLSIATSAKHLYNSWELNVLGLWSNCDLDEQEMEDVMQQSFFGCRAFTGGLARPSSIVEARDRLIYVAHNIMRLDEGECRLKFGNFFAFCPETINCSAWPLPSEPGTLDHYDHSLLAHARLTSFDHGQGADTMAHVLGRMLMPEKMPLNTSQSRDMYGYLEAGALGQLYYPSAVRFIVASFSRLFGTMQEDGLIEWAKLHSWPVAWSLGLMDDDGSCGWNFSTRGGHLVTLAEPRLLDPRTAHVLNATVGSLSSLRTLRAEALRLRLQGWTPKRSPQAWQHLWGRAKEALEPGTFQPLRAGDCSDPERCVGTSHGRCICRHAKEDKPADLVV